MQSLCMISSTEMGKRTAVSMTLATMAIGIRIWRWLCTEVQAANQYALSRRYEKIEPALNYDDSQNSLGGRSRQQDHPFDAPRLNDDDGVEVSSPS